MDFIMYGIVAETTGKEINDMGNVIMKWTTASGVTAAIYYYKPIITIY